jgi:hypothetical protein
MRRVLLAIVVGLVSVSLSLVAVELGLRAAGYRPWVAITDAPIEPVLHDPDDVLGWWLRPGHWRFGPYARGGAMVEVTIGSDRTRRTRPNPSEAPPAPEVMLLGCSFTFGWAVSDDETWAWQLQELRPQLRITNRAVGAYGTFQSLLLLERVLAEGARPQRVVYAFASDHIMRNVNPQKWMKMLAVLSRQHFIAVPYCTLGSDGGIVRHPPQAYPAWPLRSRSAAVALLQDGWFGLGARVREPDANEVTRQLIAAMAERCRAAGVRFSLLVLKGDDKRSEVVPFAQERGIEVIDCDRTISPQDRVPGDVHPNRAFNRGWAECVANGLG